MRFAFRCSLKAACVAALLALVVLPLRAAQADVKDPLPDSLSLGGVTLYATVDVELPRQLTSEQRQHFEALQKIENATKHSAA